MTFQFDFFSLVFAVIAVLYIFLGLRKGFSYMLLFFVAPIFILIISLIAAQPLGRVLMDQTPIGASIYGPLYPSITNMSTYFQEENPGREMLATVISSNNFEALTQMGIPAFIAPILASLLLSCIPLEADTTLIGEYVAKGATYAICFLIAAVAVYIVLAIIVGIFKMIRSKKRKKAAKDGFKYTPNALSRVIGMVEGAFVSVVTISVIAYVLELMFIPDPQLGGFLNSIWYLDNPDVMTVGKWIIANNPLGNVLLAIFSTFNF